MSDTPTQAIRLYESFGGQHCVCQARNWVGCYFSKRLLPSQNTGGQCFNRPEDFECVVKHASIISSKTPIGLLFQLKNFRVQGRMHFNDSREWIKLNTLSRIFFPSLLSPAFSVLLSGLHVFQPPALNYPPRKETALVKEQKTITGLSCCSGAAPQGHLSAWYTHKVVRAVRPVKESAAGQGPR